jgi:hypothetical protein
MLLPPLLIIKQLFFELKAFLFGKELGWVLHNLE